MMGSCFGWWWLLFLGHNNEDLVQLRVLEGRKRFLFVGAFSTFATASTILPHHSSSRTCSSSGSSCSCARRMSEISLQKISDTASWDEDSSTMLTPDDNDEDDDSGITARSCFGTKAYWDDMYAGRGDFPMSEYSWYYDWNVIQAHLSATATTTTTGQGSSSSSSSPLLLGHCRRDDRILIPGIGNDPLLRTLVEAGYRHLTAQDYSPAAILRQRDLLADLRGVDVRPASDDIDDDDDDDHDTNNPSDKPVVMLSCCNVLKPLPYPPESFDIILEKGLLDAVYLSRDDEEDGGAVVRLAVQHLTQSLRNGGIFVSISGVLPSPLRRDIFAASSYECWRDGSDDLQAGCFIFEKRTQ